MELPWTTNSTVTTEISSAGTGAPGNRDAFVMGSRFELSSPWRSAAFLMLSLRIWRQARRSPGLVGVSLRAFPVRKTYWTLSAWTDEAALREFARTDPHRTIMKKARPWTSSATFRFWTVPAGDLKAEALWADAEARISGAE